MKFSRDERPRFVVRRFSLLIQLVAGMLLLQSCVTIYSDGRQEYPEMYRRIRRFFSSQSETAWKPEEVEPFLFYRPAEIPVLLAPRPDGPVKEHLILEGLPPVLDQGDMPAGAVFSAGYVATTLLIRGRQSAFRCSPSFLFRMLNGSEENGVEVLDVLRLLQNTGCANLSHFPYSTPADYGRPVEDSIIRDARNYRIGGFARVDLRDEEQVKNHLLAGRPIIVGLVLPENLLGLTGPLFDWPEGNVVGRQNMAIVGLDGEHRQLLVQNSMGEKWGGKGRAWIPLDWLSRLVIDAYVIY